ncbi:type IV secretion system DNA-binding domain-containing protein [Kutzneria albida]|uniref:type IV secretion system DNA-binding domain-containing protein n=1 Tax=Kutzneria albida TaxID=43357 RepID=UPI00046CC27F|nr:type IV secretion system DNA-binding domain-containing protein [Kutzneria albida]
MESGLHGWLVEFLRDPWGTVQVLLAWLAAWVVAWGPIAGPVLVVGVGLAAALHGWWRVRCHARWAADARLITVLAPPTVDPAGATALWSNLIGLLRPGWARLLRGQPHLAVEFVFDRDGVRIQVWVPGVVPPGMVERALQAAWPGAHTRTAPASAPLPITAPRGRRTEAVGGELRLARNEALPVRTEHAADPLRPLLGAAAGLGPTEQACVQILARPVTGRRVASARRAARRVHTGQSRHLAGRLLDLLTPCTTPRRPLHHASRSMGVLDRQTNLEHSAQDRAIVAKHRAPQYETRIRYAVSTTVDTRAHRAPVRQVLRGRGHAIAAATAVYSEHNYYRRTRLRRPVEVLAQRRLRSGDLLSVGELAALAHLPTDETIPGLQRAGANAVPPPPGVGAIGPGIKPLGNSDTGHPRPIGLQVADARHHVHILGATGSGKSELMARMILDDVQSGRGVVVVDPKGDLVSDLLMRLPEHLGPKVVLFDADSRACPPVLNPLEGTDTARAVDHLVSIMSRIYASSWGPRTDDILRAGLLTLTAKPEGTPTLTDLPTLLTVYSARARAMKDVTDEVLAGFWLWYDQLSEAGRAQAIAPLMNKLRGVLLRPFVRGAIAGGRSTVDMDAVLNEGGICLVRISKDSLGTDTARLLGSIVVARVWQAATRRARLPQRHRPDAALYLDECHNFLHLPYTLQDMLAEARGYRLSMVLAHQYLAQLPRELDEGISTNARSKVIFTASPEDAHRLARHTLPQLGEHDLANLGAFQIATRLVVHGAETPAFTAITEKLPPPIPGRAKAIRKAARINAQPPTPQPTPTATARPSTDPRRAT